MKIHFIIEIEDAPGKPTRATVGRLLPVSSVDGKSEMLVSPAAALDMIKRKPGRPRKATVFPIVKEEPPTPPAVREDLSAAPGPVFDPAFVGIISNLPEPFTRRAIAAATGLELNNVTLRLNRMKHAGWIENPAPGLWRKTKNYGGK